MSAHAVTWDRRSPQMVPLSLCGDERLARLAATGEARAFAALYERHHQALYRYCRGIVRHEHDAQDVLQATMASALAAIAGLDGVPVRAWLFRIAHNESISLLRRRRVSVELADAPEPQTPSAEAELFQRDRLATLVADLQDLPERQRSAVVMRELSGLGHDEIAVALATSPGVAKQTIFEARAGLADFAEGRAMGM